MSRDDVDKKYVEDYKDYLNQKDLHPKTDRFDEETMTKIKEAKTIAELNKIMITATPKPNYKD